MKKIFLLPFLAFAFIACNEDNQDSTSREVTDDDLAMYLQLGDSIANNAQATLLQNVAAAIQQGGTDFAVEFCNTRAIPLTDSVGQAYEVSLQRLSDKNRNAENAIETGIDKEAWEEIVSERKHFIKQNEEGKIFYYKPIMIGMETCLKCHGSKDDISSSTQKIIAEKYTADKAIGYQMGDLRGMWKIGFTE